MNNMVLVEFVLSDARTGDIVKGPEVRNAAGDRIGQLLAREVRPRDQRSAGAFYWLRDVRIHPVEGAA